MQCDALRDCTSFAGARLPFCRRRGGALLQILEFVQLARAVSCPDLGFDAVSLVSTKLNYDATRHVTDLTPLTVTCHLLRGFDTQCHLLISTKILTIGDAHATHATRRVTNRATLTHRPRTGYNATR